MFRALLDPRIESRCHVDEIKAFLRIYKGLENSFQKPEIIVGEYDREETSAIDVTDADEKNAADDDEQPDEGSSIAEESESAAQNFNASSKSSENKDYSHGLWLCFSDPVLHVWSSLYMHRKMN